MRRITIAIGLGLLVSLAVSCAVIPFRQEPARASPHNDPQGFVARLRGTWKQESRTVDGKAINDQNDCFLVVTDDDRLESHVSNGSTLFSSTDIVGNQFFRVDSTGDVVAIDMTGMSDWSDLELGICRLERDTLTICQAKRNMPRPTQFATGNAPGMGIVMCVYKRTASR